MPVRCPLPSLGLSIALVVCATPGAAQGPEAAALRGPAPITYPATARRPVGDAYLGTKGPRWITEDYRWLESLDAADVKDWVTLQDTATRRYLDALPSRAAIRDELRRLIGNAPVTRTALRSAGGKLFALKRQPPKNQPMLVMLDDPDALDGERVVVDPNVRNPKGTTAIDWFVPSNDARLVAVSLSDNGSEKGTLRVFDTATGNELGDVVPRVQNPTAGGSVAWNADGNGVWYTRYPAPSERPAADLGFHQQVYFHKLGTRSTLDTKALVDGLPRIAEIALESSDDGRFTLATVRDGDGGDTGFWLRGPGDGWRRLADFKEGFRAVTFGRDGRLYGIALKGSPRGRIVSMKLDAASLARATTLVPQSEEVIERLVPTATRIYAEVLRGGPSGIRAWTLAGKPLPSPTVERVASATLGPRLSDDGILYGQESFVTPFSWYRIDPRRDGGKPVRTALSSPDDQPPLDDVAVTLITARSADGTPVPVSVVARKDVRLDGDNPTLLTGYGAYGLSQRPRFARRNVFWLRHGGVFAVAHLRGGGEFGDDWHRAGYLTRKQNVFDDFAAAAETLVDRGYTRPKKLAIEGRSNGGLLMGAALVQHPALFGAVVSHVGIYDMLRVETTPNGAFNVNEFGTVTDPAQFDALEAYSPLHHVEDGKDYPPLLMTTGINDGRVAPWQSLKMAARMQAANPKGAPVLLRVAGDAGHGQGMSLSSSVELDVDTFAFLFDRLGLSTTVSATPEQPVAGPGLPETK